jgi:hypothetical protein
LVLLDATGKVRQERLLPRVRTDPGFSFLRPLPLWVADLDGDGFDEVMWLDPSDRKLVAVRNGITDELWVMKRDWSDAVLAVRSAVGGKPGTVVVRESGTVRGYDSKTGKPLWACAGPGTGEYLPPPTPGAPPLVLFTTAQHGTIARRALPVGPDGKFVVPTK